MLSYRHEFHAGNLGDLVKHAALSLVIDYLKQKPAPILYIDTHAGAGLYSTVSAMASKTGEYRLGVGALGDDVLPAALTSYQEVLSRYKSQHQYPGSPLLAAQLLRPQDRLRLFEMHSTEYPRLANLFARDRRVLVANSDGYASLKALLPAKNARALVLVDPSYEVRADYEAVCKCLDAGYARMPHAVYIIWYPVVGNPSLDFMLRKIRSTVQEKLWRFELARRDETAVGMTATGVLVVNPPYTLAANLEAAFRAIGPHLPGGPCSSRPRACAPSRARHP